MMGHFIVIYGDFIVIYGDFIVIYGDLVGFNGMYPLVMTSIAIENCPFIVSFPLTMLILHSYVSICETLYCRSISASWIEVVDLPMKHGDFLWLC